MINLIPPVTDAPYVQSVNVSRNGDLETLFQSRSHFTTVNSPSPYGTRHRSNHRCFANLTEDACCTVCGLEFEP